MVCNICKNGETLPGQVTVPLEQDGTFVLVKEVPAEVCDNCGEFYLSSEITSRLLAQAEKAYQKGAEVEIVRFAA